MSSRLPVDIRIPPPLGPSQCVGGCGGEYIERRGWRSRLQRAARRPGRWPGPGARRSAPWGPGRPCARALRRRPECALFPWSPTPGARDGCPSPPQTAISRRGRRQRRTATRSAPPSPRRPSDPQRSHQLASPPRLCAASRRARRRWLSQRRRACPRPARAPLRTARRTWPCQPPRPEARATRPRPPWPPSLWRRRSSGRGACPGHQSTTSRTGRRRPRRRGAARAASRRTRGTGVAAPAHTPPLVKSVLPLLHHVHSYTGCP
mmetsp:Transcript_29441/g.56548  ORF Transcript_29441/g.56548 Transcript_29441/m.56548 type:complete len:263 (+) Transcript_29441:1365-2153(+)